MSCIKKKHWGINRKVLTSVILLTFVISILSCFSGSLIFDKVIQRLYNERGYVIGDIILNEIDHDKIAQYVTTWQEDEYYPEMKEYLRFIEDASDAAYIYITVPYEDRTMRYVYDSVYGIGLTDPIAASFEEIWKAYTEGVKPESYLVRRSEKYGFLTSSCLPIKDSNGNVVALLFVDTNMEVINSTLYSYITHMLIISTFLLTGFCIVHWFFMHKNLISPLLAIRRNVREFAKNNMEIDDSITDIHTNDELEELAGAVNQMEHDIVSYVDNIKAITAEKERIGAELSVAAKIQIDMLPRIFPLFEGIKEFDIYASMSPAKVVGGDFYDFFLIDDDHIALVMADVSGKGVPAALFMVVAKTLIKNRTLMGGELSPGEILTDVNHQLCESNETELFVTVWFAILEISTGKGIAANAGHEHPAIRRANGEYELSVYKHSPVIAGIDGIQYIDHEFELKPGDALFVYTDGVTEATSADEKLFGTKRLIDSLNKSSDATSKELLSNVKKDIDEFVGDAPQFDDITMMSFRYLENKTD
ncbi:MAG: SpoIIE family protein phosphatase [Butyrivibrio sp.]|nr:SpoIIE family protein phosphatase [Butyrivibrio sp.]